MKISKYSASMIPSGLGGPNFNVLSSVSPYSLVAETQLTVGVVPQVIATPPAGFTYSFMIINRSVAAQTVRSGFAPAYAVPNVGIMTLVNEVIIFENINFALSIVASGAGALVDVLVTSQVI